MTELLPLMVTPFVACMVLVAMLAYLGVHVIGREVIFVDLALAQMAALGGTVALLFGFAPGAPGAYVFALGFTTAGAFIFAVTRTVDHDARVPHEAIIGVVYIVASAAVILVANQAPRGAEVIEATLVGSILWVNWASVGRLAAAFVVIGAFHWVFRRRFLTISLDPATAKREGWAIRWWDFLFYLSFGMAITLAVPVAGVLLVFTFLVVPAIVAFLFTRNTRALMLISWGTSAVASALGLLISFRFDLPTGPVIVCTFGLVLLVAGVVRRMVPAA